MQQQNNHQLTKQLREEKRRIEEGAIQRQKELSATLEQLRISTEGTMKAKDEQIAQLTTQIEQMKKLPQVDEFKAEALQLNKALINQVKLLCQQITQAEPLCELVASIREKVEKARTDLDQAEETLTNFIEWKDFDQGQATNLPRILESHKEILFTEWQSQLMKAERAIFRCKATTGNLVELVNNTLYLSNVISQCTPGQLTATKMLEHSCYPELEKNRRLIAGINSLTWDAYWFFLIKPYSQRAALKCLTDAIGYIIPDIQDATFAAQFSLRLNRPPEVEPMLAISQLRFKGKQPES